MSALSARSPAARADELRVALAPGSLAQGYLTARPMPLALWRAHVGGESGEDAARLCA